MRYLFWVMLFVLSWVVNSEAAQVKVIDGDSLLVDDTEMRLEGIDAPEYSQICYDTNKKEYSCGQKAMDYMKTLVGPGIKCKKITIDRYKRVVAVCKVKGKDINKQMVEAGWAVAYNRYSHDYEEAEAEAKQNKRGIWQGKFMKPELYRALSR